MIKLKINFTGEFRIVIESVCNLLQECQNVSYYEKWIRIVIENISNFFPPWGVKR